MRWRAVIRLRVESPSTSGSDIGGEWTWTVWRYFVSLPSLLTTCTSKNKIMIECYCVFVQVIYSLACIGHKDLYLLMHRNELAVSIPFTKQIVIRTLYIYIYQSLYGNLSAYIAHYHHAYSCTFYTFTTRSNGSRNMRRRGRRRRQSQRQRRLPNGGSLRPPSNTFSCVYSILWRVVYFILWNEGQLVFIILITLIRYHYYLLWVFLVPRNNWFSFSRCVYIVNSCYCYACMPLIVVQYWPQVLKVHRTCM